MYTSHQLVGIILDETLACQDPNSSQSKTRSSGAYRPLGPYIPGDRGSYPTTDAAMNALAELADTLRQNASELKVAVSRDRMRMIVSEAFGACLNELVGEPDRNKHWKILRTRILESARDSGKQIVHYVPVWLFTGQDCLPFNIGPVKFVPRAGWLEEIRKRRGKSSPWMATVERLWSGEVVRGGSTWCGLKGAASALRRGKSGPRDLYRAYADGKRFSEPSDLFHGRVVSRLVHPDQWVACCDIQGFETSESRRRGILAARVALDTIRLALVRPNRALISTSADSVQPFAIDRLSQLPNRDLAHGSGINRKGLSGAPGLATAIVDQSSELFDAAGQCIGAAATTSINHGCPKLAERWLNAVHWYGRACIADVDFVGVVMLVIALDVLSGGLEQKGILELIARLTGLRTSHVVLNDGTSLKQLVERTYKLRSEVAHGSILAVHADLDEVRGYLEDLASAALDHYVIALKKYAETGGADDRDEFVKSLPPLIP